MVKIIKIVGTLLRCMGEGREKHTCCRIESRAESVSIDHSLSRKHLFGEVKTAINIVCNQFKVLRSIELQLKTNEENLKEKFIKRL